MDLQWRTVLLRQVMVMRMTCGNGIRDTPNDLEKAELETIAAFRSYAEIREYEETCVFVAILRVLEMVERGYD